jgi:hypothetical protein
LPPRTRPASISPSNAAGSITYVRLKMGQLTAASFAGITPSAEPTPEPTPAVEVAAEVRRRSTVTIKGGSQNKSPSNRSRPHVLSEDST